MKPLDLYGVCNDEKGKVDIVEYEFTEADKGAFECLVKEDKTIFLNIEVIMTKSFIEKVRNLYKNAQDTEGKSHFEEDFADDALALEATVMAERLIAIDNELTKIEEGGNWQMGVAANRIRKILEGEQDA